MLVLKKILCYSALSLFSSIFTSMATASVIYEYDINNPPGSKKAGKILNVSTSFNTDTNLLSWSHTVKDKGSKASDGFWLVVSPGANPKTHVEEYAIFYGDSDTNKLTAYEYSGANKSTSWSTPGNFLGSFDLDYSHTGSKGLFSFAIDTTDINNASLWGYGSDWVGAAFGEKIGIWLHPMLDADFSYDGNDIDGLNYSKSGWYDTGNRVTNRVEVSEPTSLALFALLIAGLSIRNSAYKNAK